MANFEKGKNVFHLSLRRLCLAEMEVKSNQAPRKERAKKGQVDTKKKKTAKKKLTVKKSPIRFGGQQNVCLCVFRCNV